jgi:predicted lipid-binding transport protein (Tim44 family)
MKASDVSDTYLILLLAVVTVLIILKLRSVLGQRTGRERPPYDPYSARDAVPNATGDKVVTLPQRNGSAEQPARPAEPGEASPDRYAGFALPGTAIAGGLDSIARADRGFDVKQFIAGARAAYEMIVTAYATGDRRSLKGLLEREVYDGFDAVIRQREVRGETVETRFVSIDASEIINAQLRGKVAQITLRFVSQLVSATRNRNDNVIDGSADSVTTVTDIWTFAREVTSRDPNWKLVATEGGA